MWILYAAILWEYKGWLLLAAMVWAWWKVWQHPELGGVLRRKLAQRRAEREALAARCDSENLHYLNSGIIEGQYPGATMPLFTRDRPDWSFIRTEGELR